MGVKLRLTGRQHVEIKDHVLAKDGNESAALLFCEPVFREGDCLLLVKEIICIPYDACTIRTPVALSWPTKEFLIPHYERIEKKGLSLVMLHSHPNGFDEFSSVDDENDIKILPRLMSSIDGNQPHGSAIMLSDGTIKGRTINSENEFVAMDLVSVAGDDIFFWGFRNNDSGGQYIKKTNQVYGSATTDILRNLRIGVVGCSGTGSPLTELLLRYHVGHIVLVDFDVIEDGNLNRMLMSRTQDAEKGVLKVHRYAEWIEESGLPTKATAINDHVPSNQSILALSECDVLFGCVDNIVARHALNKIACAYLIPYFDLGVAIRGNERQSGSIRQAISRCHYLQPDQSCLLDRKAFSAERLGEESLRKDDPEFYKKLKELGYTHEPNDIQAVMVLTMEAAVMGMDDFMARLNGYRVDSNRSFDEQERSFTHGYYEHREHSADNLALRLFFASGDKHTRL